MESRQRRQTPPSQANGGSGDGGITPNRKLITSVLRLLSVRPYSRQEIYRYLQRKTSDESLIQNVLDTIEKSGFIDDEKFALWLVESYSRSKPKGKALLVRELKQKGISSEIIDKAITRDMDEVSLADSLIQKKQKLWSHLSPKEFRLKTTRFLYSRGFTWNTIEQIIKKRYN